MQQQFKQQNLKPRSTGTLYRSRERLPWPKDRNFNILSLDGGGIRGIYPASVLAGLEETYLDGNSITDYFDLITGTSTGGIIALGLAAGLSASELRDLYLNQGGLIFPPYPKNALGLCKRYLWNIWKFVRYRYDRVALTHLLNEKLGEKKLGDAKTRLCIPAFEGHFGEVFVFKTPHHPDFKKDLFESMVKVALSTAAAPTFYKPHQDGG
jgi:patatin-like phospholipase/acyl hydrolase